MVSIGDIFLGGSKQDSISGKNFFSAICFELTEKSRINVNHTAHEDNLDWEIEICENSNYIVARCEQILNINETISRGNDICQGFLDYLSIEDNYYNQIQFPFDSVFILYYDNSQFILQNTALLKLNFNIKFSLKMFDEKGIDISNCNVKTQNIPDFTRYYRKSCLSQDVFDAYRNLYLSFESMLNKINPIKKRQREIEWLKESLNIVNTKVPLINHVPSVTVDPVEHIFVEQYLNIRIKLFHAKTDNILPESLSRIDVEQAYKKLLRLWRDIAIQFFNLQLQVGGITLSAFYDMMDNMFSPNFSIQMTCDNSPAKSSDLIVSPENKNILTLNNYSYTHDSVPEDQITLSGSIEKPEFDNFGKIFRIWLLGNSGTLFSVENYESGLLLEGVDVFKKEYLVKFVYTSSS